jgi:hypothetical protein
MSVRPSDTQTPKKLRAKPDRSAREFDLKVIQPAVGCFF